MSQMFQRDGRWKTLDQIQKKEPVVEVEVVEQVAKKFCQFCDAKGPISHKKACTRPK